MKMQSAFFAATIVLTTILPGALCTPRAPEVPECPKPNIAPDINATSPAVSNEVLEMRLHGALCPACLKHLEAKLLQLKGITEAHVELANDSEQQAHDNHASKRFASVLIKLDSHKTSVQEIMELVKANDFGISRLVLKPDAPPGKVQP